MRFFMLLIMCVALAGVFAPLFVPGSGQQIQEGQPLEVNENYTEP